MCIIAVKPKGVSLPDDDLIETMWLNNPDGGGLMYHKDGKVYIDKGYMTLASYVERIDRLRKGVDVMNTAIVFHMRIGTHGGNTPENTHPFPISPKLSDLQALHTRCKLGVAHNGIVHIKITHEGISDTMQYILDDLVLLRALNRDFYKSTAAVQLIKQHTGSLWAMLDGEGHVAYVGKFHRDDGMLYSNYSYFYSQTLAYCEDAYGWGSDYAAIAAKSKNGNRKGQEVRLVMLNPEIEYVVLPDGALVDAMDFGIDSDGNIYEFVGDDEVVRVDMATVMPLTTKGGTVWNRFEAMTFVVIGSYLDAGYVCEEQA